MYSSNIYIYLFNFSGYGNRATRCYDATSSYDDLLRLSSLPFIRSTTVLWVTGPLKIELINRAPSLPGLDWTKPSLTGNKRIMRTIIDQIFFIYIFSTKYLYWKIFKISLMISVLNKHSISYIIQFWTSKPLLILTPPAARARAGREITYVFEIHCLSTYGNDD